MLVKINFPSLSDSNRFYTNGIVTIVLLNFFSYKEQQKIYSYLEMYGVLINNCYVSFNQQLHIKNSISNYKHRSLRIKITHSIIIIFIFTYYWKTYRRTKYTIWQKLFFFKLFLFFWAKSDFRGRIFYNVVPDKAWHRYFDNGILI